MSLQFFVVIFFVVLGFAVASEKSSVRKRCIFDDYYTDDDLPKLYSMEDYKQCAKLGGTFCIADFFIEPDDPDSHLGKEIQRSKLNRLRFDRSKIYRMKCLSKNETSNVETVVKKSVDTELQEFHLETKIKEVRCEPTFYFTNYDFLYAALLIGYAALVLKSTKYDILDRKKVKSKYEKLYNIFSMKKNWEKVFKENSSSDYQRLKFLQGIRFYAMVMVVVCHTKLSFGSLFVENPIDIEKLLQFTFYSLQFDLLMIQTFFMISTFLLTNQIYEIYKTNGEFTLYDCWVLYINRVMRLFPTVTLVVLLVQLLTKTMPIGPQVWNLFFMVYQECQTNWWLTLFQFNFLLNFNEMCMPGSWYLGVDTLLYITTLVLLYVTFKFKLDLKKVLGVTFVLMFAKFAHVIYVNDFEVMVLTSANIFRDIYHSNEFNDLYISAASSYSTCCVGIAMGAIYFYIKDKNIKLNIVHSFLWYLIFFGTPFLLVYIATREYSSVLVRSLLGPLLKPAYALAIGIGVLGLTKNLGGTVRKILEWKFAVRMSNLTYCVYLFHFLMVFSKGVFSNQLIYFQPYQVGVYLVIDVVASFIIGGLCTITVELPWSEVQKMYAPQIKKVRKSEKTSNLGNEAVPNGTEKSKAY